MGKLFICEKPSMAKVLAEYLGKNKSVNRKNGYYQVDDDYIAWLKGHIMALYEPEDYREDWAREGFNYYNLPMIPDVYKKKIKTSYGKDASGKDRPTNDYKNIFFCLKNLSKQVDVIVNSGDADAEGQVLVDEVIEELGWHGKEERIFITAYDNESIRRALDNIEDNKSPKNVNLSRSALCRSITDWLIGMNGSRKFTYDAGESVSVGRVKVPIMALVKRRNEEIDNFKSKDFYEPAIIADFDNRQVACKWKPKEDCILLDEENRLVNKDFAEELIKKVTGKSIKVVDVIKKHQKERQPLPFSLAKLQEFACSKLGISLKKFDEILQILYEEKKLLTYPRSDCQYIPESQFGDAKRIIGNLCLVNSLKSIAENADSQIKSKAFDSSKTTAHHAIIPTSLKLDVSKLDELEIQVYEIVAKRYLMQFYPEHEFDSTEIVFECEGESFIAKGKVVTESGWKSLVSSEDKEEMVDEGEVQSLPDLVKNDIGDVRGGKIVVKTTSPPKYFTQESLIAALTNAYKYVYDKKLADVVKSIKGIGTPATRSGIIDELLFKGFLIEKQIAKSKKKYLFVSDRASELVDALPNALTYPDQTALMELDLEKVCAGTMDLSSFRKIIEDYVKDLMKIKAHFSKGVECPSCHKGSLRLSKDGKIWFCNRYNVKGDECKASFSNIDGKPGVFQCPACKKGFIWRSKVGKFYCSNFSGGCMAHFEEKKGVPVVVKDISCPVCKVGSLVKNSFGGWSCTNWKNGCKAIFENVSNKPYTKQCSVCNNGYLRKSKAGKWYCTNFNSCKSFYQDEKGKPVLVKKRD